MQPGCTRRSLPKQRFKDEVEQYLSGESEPSDLIYFKLYKSQLPVIEQALEAAARSFCNLFMAPVALCAPGLRRFEKLSRRGNSRLHGAIIET